MREIEGFLGESGRPAGLFGESCVELGVLISLVPGEGRGGVKGASLEEDEDVLARFSRDLDRMVLADAELEIFDIEVLEEEGIEDIPALRGRRTLSFGWLSSCRLFSFKALLIPSSRTFFKSAAVLLRSLWRSKGSPSQSGKIHLS